MSGAASRSKGHRAERDVAKYLRSRGYVDAHTTRSQLGHDGFHAPGDVVGPVGLVIEVKDVAANRWREWCRQASAEAGNKDWVVVRKRRGTSDPASWEAVDDVEWTLAAIDRRAPQPRPFGEWLDWWSGDESEAL